MSRLTMVLLAGLGILYAADDAAPKEKPKRGLTTPGVVIPLSQLKPDAIFPVPGSPDWSVVGTDAVWISNKPKNSVSRLDPKTNKVAEVITVGSKPCSGLAIGFGSLWVPNCGDRTLSRVDLATNKVTATVPMGIADTEGGIATGAGSVWMMTDKNGTLSRIDPSNNKVVADIYVPKGSYTVAFGEGAVWVTSTEGNSVTRVDPNTNLVVETIPVGKAPRFLAVGEGGVWTLNQTDGTVTRVDPKTNKVVATIDCAVPGEGGDIAAGEGSVWVTSFGIPITRIDPLTNKAVQQFVGEGGDAIRVGLGSVWLSNYKGETVWRLDPKRIEATQAP
ncbi:MAG TPA: glutaminyl-peptide cyclotransferase [Bryobacteraceae bacterium]|nr:glutaminyl-peptide cyclotransferase [Bryobacteraceae bacterium]